MTAKHHYHLERLTDVHSKLLDRDTVVDIFLPYQFEKAEKPFPLLILNDGQDGEAIALKETLEELTLNKSIKGIVVVAVHAGDRMQEYGVAGHPDFKKRGKKAKDYTRFVMAELIPYIHYRYSISDEVADRAIAGFSMGGLSAVDIAWHHADYFGKAGAFSGSFWWRKRDAKSRLYSDTRDRIMHSVIRKGRHKPGLKFWFQTGLLDETADRNKNGVIDSIDDTLDLIVELTKKGYRPFHDIQYYEMADGEHNLPTWKRAMPEFLKWAFKN
ncbi:MAG: esterase family protein [Cyclobacteriaceae bacterium]|nr:esterase family protein [Cyclobacteriaceae bacterium]UYN86540.1 MAG: esterase family protein [Cyclobacteriaceae bacterium]